MTRITNTREYAVIVQYSWSPNEGRLILCDTEEEAKEFLKEDFQNEVALDEENGNTFTSEMSEDGLTASITNYRRSGDVDVTTWTVVLLDIDDMRAGR